MPKTELSQKKEFIRAAAIALLAVDYRGGCPVDIRKAWYLAEQLWANKPKDD